MVRSTRVPIADLPSPRIRSPSRCRATAWSPTLAGRWLIRTSGWTNFLLRPRVRDPHRLITGEVDGQPIGDLLRTPRRRPPACCRTTLPRHVRADHRPSARPGDGPAQSLLHVLPQLGISREPGGLRSWAPRSACHCAVGARYSSRPPRVSALRRSSPRLLRRCVPTGGRSLALPRAGPSAARSPHVRRTTGTARTVRPG